MDFFWGGGGEGEGNTIKIVKNSQNQAKVQNQEKLFQGDQQYLRIYFN